MKEVIKYVIDLCNSGGPRNDGEKAPIDDSQLLIENHPIPVLFALIEQHKLHSSFLKERGMCDDERNDAIIEEIEIVFAIIKIEVQGQIDLEMSHWIVLVTYVRYKLICYAVILNIIILVLNFKSIIHFSRIIINMNAIGLG